MSNCVECDQQIAHPICEGCLSMQFAAWLQEQSKLWGHHYEAQHLRYNDIKTNTACVLCGHDVVECSKCTTKNFYLWLENIGASARIVSLASKIFSDKKPLVVKNTFDVRLLEEPISKSDVIG